MSEPSANRPVVRRLPGRVAIVTGAATGIGAATVARLCAEGAVVIAAGLQPDELARTAQAFGAVAHHLCDVTDEAAVRGLMDGVWARHARLDIIVNAAGIVINDDVGDITDSGWQRTLDVNLSGTMRVCRAGIELLRRSGGGAVVNVASVAAFNASAGMASYSASKAGMVALTRALANQYGAERIRANCVCPGWVRTPMSDVEMQEAALSRGVSIEAVYAELEARIALRRVADADEIAAVIAFLASDDASFVTGAALVADGGARTPASARGI